MKYYNQEYLQEQIEHFKKRSTSTQFSIIEQMKSALEQARHEVEKISDYTAPEEADRRKQTMLYYKEFIDAVEVKEEKLKYDSSTLHELLKRIDTKKLANDSIGIILEINNMLFEKEGEQ